MSAGLYQQFREYLFYLQVSIRRLPVEVRTSAEVVEYHNYLLKFTKTMVNFHRKSRLDGTLWWMLPKLIPIFIEALPHLETLAHEQEGVYTMEAYFRRKKLLALIN